MPTDGEKPQKPGISPLFTEMGWPRSVAAI